MLSRSDIRGFTLIELLFGMGLIAILAMLGLPSVSGLIQNNKISSAAGNYYSAVQLARAEAIRGNVPVEFVLTNGNGVGAAPAVGGINWIVRAVPPVGAPRLIDQMNAAEGQGSVQSVQVAVTAAPGGFDGRITFNGFGAPTDNPYSIDITNPSFGACAPAGPARCKRINVIAGGQITACDPAAVAASGDSRAC